MKTPAYTSKHDLFIIDEIEKNPDTAQASIAQNINAAVGSIDLHIKRLFESKFIKVQRSEKRRLKYSITPKGIFRKSELIKDYIFESMKIYREIREEISSIFIFAMIKNKNFLCFL